MLANDCAVWRELFYRRQGWGINLERAISRGWALPTSHDLTESPTNMTHLSDSPTSEAQKVRFSGPTSTSSSSNTPTASIHIASPSVHLLPSPHASSPWSPERPNDTYLPLSTSVHAPLFLPWRDLYQTRSALDARWTSSVPHPTYLRGHADSVYCLEFDSKRIISGSRDQTIKAWDIRTGRCLGTFKGHQGSVLCLKFEKDWDIKGDGKKGFMVSGSSDRKAFVWDIWLEENGDVRAQVRAVLRGHLDGVLDLRVDDQWIVSW
jgi:F-box and WD-40 domain protein 1/11